VSEACRVCPARFVGDAGHLLGASFGEFIPPDAQGHLINAQRELLLAVAIIIEHNASRSVTKPRATRSRRASSSARRPDRVKLE